MTALDLFSGIGGFSLAAHRAGLEVVAHCEIEPFPQAVLAYRFPNIPIFRDVKEITKETFYERTGRRTVDIVIGGSPCQDFSVAGWQRGLGGNRSGLFFEQPRIARELGAKYVVWENVPGALSSNKGEDFARILSEFTGWKIENRKWGGCGYLRNRTKDDFSVLYRVLDTRFFGIPQRRRRIYLVASLGGVARPEILFERDSVSRDSSQSGAQGKDVTAFANGGIGGYDKSNVAGTLRIGGDIKNGGSTLIAGTLDTSYAKHYRCDNQHVDAGCPNFVLFESYGQSSRYNQKKFSPTLNAKMGTGGGNVPLCVHATQDPIVSENRTHALGANSTQAVCIAKNIINRKEKNGGNGLGAKEKVSYTLNTVGVHSVAKGLSIRRLTPLECERLQGFPDGWTKIPYRGKDLSTCPDSPRYKALGNAVTVAVAEWVLKRLVKEVV